MYLVLNIFNMKKALGLENPQVTTMGNLLKTSKYNLIASQREYSWGEDDLDAFWRDLNLQEQHFFGLMFVTKVNENTVSIVEGQQRLATVTIFLSACRDIFFELNEPIHNKIDSDFINEFDYKENRSKPKLQLGEIDREFFKQYIQKTDTFENKKKQYAEVSIPKYSNELLWEAYQYFIKKIKEKTSKLNKTEKVDKIRELIDSVTNDFQTMISTVASADAVYKIFESINARGLELNNANLLKNYIFSQADYNLDSIRKDWFILQTNLDESLNSFLRYFWIAHYGLIREGELYDELSKKIKTPDLALDFVQELKKNADIFVQIINPTKQYWGSDNTVVLLKEIESLNYKQFLPLILIAKYKFSNAEVENILKGCINFTFRYSTICNLHNNKLQSIYDGIIKGIRSGEIKSASGVIEKLKIESPVEQVFINKFKTKEITRSALARYILQKINFSMQGNVKEQMGIDELTLEHIMPKKLNLEWTNYLKSKGLDPVIDEEKIKSLIYCIGNFTLLAGEYNKDAENYIFIKKRDDVYVHSLLPINKPLKNITDWSQQEILIRATELGKIAEKIWSI